MTVGHVQSIESMGLVDGLADAPGCAACCPPRCTLHPADPGGNFALLRVGEQSDICGSETNVKRFTSRITGTIFPDKNASAGL